MNEKKQSQQLATVGSAHHQKRQQSVGVTSTSGVGNHQMGVGGHNGIQNSANQSVPGGIGLMMGNNNINVQNMRGTATSTASGVSSNNYIQINTENRAAAIQFIRNSYASGSRMKKVATNSNNNESANLVAATESSDPHRQHQNATNLLSQLEQSGLIPSHQAHNQSAMKKGSRDHQDQNIAKKIKVMRNTHGSSGVSGSSNNQLLIVPSQQMALQGQIGNMSNINHLRQKSPVPQSPSAAHQKQMLLLQLQNGNPNTNGQNTGQAPPGGNAASLKSARRYQLMNSQQKNPSSVPPAGSSITNAHHHNPQLVNVNSAGVGLGSNQGQLLPTHTQLSPQNLSQQFQNQFSQANSSGVGNIGNQTMNIAQFKQQIANQKINLSLERPSNHNNDLILQSPNSSDTNSSINSLDQTLRVRIGGPLPKGILSSSQSSSSGTSGVGVHPNHFYQSSSLNRDNNNAGVGANYNSQQQQQPAGNHHQMILANQNNQSTNNSNFNSLDYSEIAMSSRRMYNESNNGGGGGQINVNSSTIQQQQITQSNVKRNNFLAMFNGPMEAGNDSGVKSPESHSQPNPPTLRKITLNQRILQKNMARVSAQNQAQHQNLMNNHDSTVQAQEEAAIQQQITTSIRQKKYSTGQAPTKATHMHLSAPTAVTGNPPNRETSVSSTASETQQPMINVARIQQAINKIYGSSSSGHRKNSIINHANHPPQGLQVPIFNQEVGNSTQTIERNGSQMKRKQIKMKQGGSSSFGGVNVIVGDSAAQMSMTTQPTNTSTDQQNQIKSSGGNVPQLNLNTISQEIGISQALQQSATSPINMKQHIHQGHIASSSRRQMRETQRSKINMTQQDTARGSLPINTINPLSQNPQELTNRSHLAHAPMHISDPLPVQQANQQLTSHRGQVEAVASINPRTLTSARRDREQQLRSVNAVASTHLPLEAAPPVNSFSDIEKPTTPQVALKYAKQHLTQYELQEIIDYPQIFYVGENCKRKTQGSMQNEFNYGYDDNKGNYKVSMNDHIGYRYEIQQFLGKGSFGQAIRCFDHKRQEMVALKVIKNKKKYYYQAGVELKILQYLRDNDPDDTMNIIHMKDYVIFRKHLCISFELMSINLYDFLKLNDFDGLSLSLIRRFAIQLLYALKYLKENDIIHCDLKPENILLKDPTKSGIKIIDFGSSCFSDERVYTYIQSRFYRAPEIILGIPYTTAIDMWSFGCIMAEFCIGYPLFPGEDEMEQLAMMMEVCNKPSGEVLKTSQRRKKFFNDDNTPILVPNRKHQVRVPGSKDLFDILETDDDSFVDFVSRCLDWDPQTRMSPDEALRHAWILEGLPPKVLIHHQKLHNIPTNDLPPKIREIRQQYLLKEQQQNQQPEQQLMMTQPIQQQTPQQQQYRSEPRRQQQPSILSQNQNNNSAVIKRVSNQQLLGVNQHQGGAPGAAQSDTRIQQQQFNQTQQLNSQQQQMPNSNFNQTQPLIISQQQHQLLQLSNTGGQQPTDPNNSMSTKEQIQNNLISPRTKKIVMNNTTTSGQEVAANKNHLILKTTGGQNSADTNKSLENTLRNRKIILSSGLKRSSEANADISGGGPVSTSLTRKQIIFANNNQGGVVSMASNMSNAISDL